jgi:hypothetical protein
LVFARFKLTVTSVVYVAKEKPDVLHPYIGRSVYSRSAISELQTMSPRPLNVFLLHYWTLTPLDSAAAEKKVPKGYQLEACCV